MASPLSAASPNSLMSQGSFAPEDPILQVFSLFDLDSSGQISTEDLPYVLKSIGMGPDMLSFAEVTELQLTMDPQGTGKISYAAFSRFVLEEMSATNSNEELWRAFRLFDQEKRGFITERDLVRVAHEECGGVLTPQQCKFIMRQLQSGAHRSGMTFSDFKVAMASTHLD